MKATEGSVIALANARFGGGCAQLERRTRNTWWLRIDLSWYPYKATDESAFTLEQLQARIIRELRARIERDNALIADTEAGRYR